MSTQAPTDSRSHFQWQAHPGTPAVVISRDVMENMAQDVLSSYQGAGVRGTEVAGILLGSRQPDSGYRIEDYQPVPLEFARFSAEWRERVREARASVPGFIGLYRSQVRPGLMVTPYDCAQVEALLPREEGVLLLVKPLSHSECVGSFFLCDGGVVIDEAEVQREFPFGASAQALVPKPRPKWLKALIPITAVAVGVGMALFFRANREQPAPAENPIAFSDQVIPPPPQPINSYSALAPAKPARAIAPSAQTGEEESPVEAPPPRVVSQPRVRAFQAAAPAKRSGRMKRMFGGVTSKASHLWPFHSAKQ